MQSTPVFNLKLPGSYIDMLKLTNLGLNACFRPVQAHFSVRVQTKYKLRGTHQLSWLHFYFEPQAPTLLLHVFWSRLLEQLHIMFVSALQSTLPFIFGSVFSQIITRNGIAGAEKNISIMV